MFTVRSIRSRLKQGLLVAACASLPLTAALADGDVGGIDGGGGGTLPANAISVDEAVQVIHEAKRDLRLFVKYQLWGTRLREPLDPLETKLYAGSPNLWEVLENTDIEIQREQPCYDAFGKPVDGSIHASKPGAICMSAKSMAPKLIEERARVEIEALILHELIHLLGANETEAVRFQQDAVFWLKRSRDDQSYKMASGLKDIAHELSWKFQDLRSKLGKTDAATIAREMSEINRIQSGFLTGRNELPFSIHDRLESDYQDVLTDQFLLALWYTLGNSPEGASKYWQEQYEKTFDGKESVTVEEFNKKHFGVRKVDNAYKDELIFRLHGTDGLGAILQVLERYYSGQGAYLLYVETNSALNRPEGPWTVPTANLWAMFVGEYEIVSTQCSSNGAPIPDQYGTIGFLIRQDGSDPLRSLHLREISKSGYREEGLYDGAGDITGATAVFIRGGAGVAERIAESGNRWGEVWRRRSFQMSHEGENFQMVSRYLERNGLRDGGKKNLTECVFQLKKK